MKRSVRSALTRLIPFPLVASVHNPNLPKKTSSSSNPQEVEKGNAHPILVILTTYFPVPNLSLLLFPMRQVQIALPERRSSQPELKWRWTTAPSAAATTGTGGSRLSACGGSVSMARPCHKRETATQRGRDGEGLLQWGMEEKLRRKEALPTATGWCDWRSRSTIPRKPEILPSRRKA